MLLSEENKILLLVLTFFLVRGLLLEFPVHFFQPGILFSMMAISRNILNIISKKKIICYVKIWRDQFRKQLFFSQWWMRIVPTFVNIIIKIRYILWRILMGLNLKTNFSDFFIFACNLDLLLICVSYWDLIFKK